MLAKVCQKISKVGLEVGWMVYLGRDWAGDADHESEFMRFLQYDDSIQIFPKPASTGRGTCWPT